MNFSNYVANLKDKSQRQLQWKELNGVDTVLDFSKVTFDKLNDTTLDK